MTRFKHKTKAWRGKKQNHGQRLTRQWLKETILDTDTWQTRGLKYTRLMTRQGIPMNNEQTIIQWQDTWQDHMTNRESHDRHGT